MGVACAGMVEGRGERGVGKTREGAVIEALGAYLRRTVERGGWGPVEILSGPRGLRLPSARATVAVVEGARPGWWTRAACTHGAMRPAFQGGVGGAEIGRGPRRLTILDRWDPSAVPSTPGDFEVLAITTTYNELDVIEDLLARLRSETVRVHVVDNWSTDGTFEVAAERAETDKGVTVERFPADGPSPYFELEKILSHVEDLAHHCGAAWVISHDADEVRESPWPGVPLRRALWCAEWWGFNCVDHSVLNFRPVDETWEHARGVIPAGRKLLDAFDWFEFGTHHAHFRQQKTWKPQPEPVHFASSGGHDASFANQHVFPYRFLLRHYPIRSTAHGRRKVLQERQGRWSPSERAKGWHVHYDAYSESSSFLWDAASLHRFTTLSALDEEYLVERLTGAGLPENPFDGEAVGTW